MSGDLPIVLVPGLNCSARLYAEQVPELWGFGPVTIADHRRDDNVAAIAARILATAPPRFTLVGLSMGGYVAFAIAREAAERVARLALLDTSARPDMAEQSERRRGMIALAEGGRFSELPDLLFPVFVHRNRQGDEALRAIVPTMAEETGPQAFVRQQGAIMTRAECRAQPASIGCPTMVLGGHGQELTPHAVSQ